jgi:hypothetical protein
MLVQQKVYSVLCTATILDGAELVGFGTLLHDQLASSGVCHYPRIQRPITAELNHQGWLTNDRQLYMVDGRVDASTGSPGARTFTVQGTSGPCTCCSAVLHNHPTAQSLYNVNCCAQYKDSNALLTLLVHCCTPIMLR